LLPAALALAAVGALAFWLASHSPLALKRRVPGTDQDPSSQLGGANPVILGKLTRGDGRPAALPGGWPQFRGGNRDGISDEAAALARSWLAAGPRELWSLEAGEGYAGAAVLEGRVYLMDYDRPARQDVLRCLSLEDGREIWRFGYPVSVKRNHGMSRTVPAVTRECVVAMGPKCHVVCLDAVSGELRWGLDLVHEYGTTVPPWYAGQCPLIEAGAAILAPGGKGALLLAIETATGKRLWQTPNPRGWKMTHSSIMPLEVGGERQYVYCADNGVAGVSARDGSLLWETTDWKISIATVPSPLPLEGGRVFLSGGYNAGSLMLEISQENGRFKARTLFKLGPEIFGATQHTPILLKDHIYGVRADGKFVCLSLEGKVLWTSGAGRQFGLGPFLAADGLVYAMNDTGLLRLIEARPDKYVQLAEAQVLRGRESWGPMALAGGRLLARDLTRLICLEVGP
jgi:outer membrane protein assembly factor BamB